MAGEPLPPSWAAEGRAMRRALAEDFATLDGVRVAMSLDARLPDEPGPWETLRVGPGDERMGFRRLASRSDWTLCVAPETGGVLEARARWVVEVGGRSLGAAPEAISLSADKVRLAAHLAAHGINTPKSIRVRPRDGLPADYSYPAVLKPIDGAGSLDTYYVESATGAPDEALGMPEALLQPFVPGRAMSAAFLVAPGLAPILAGFADQAMVREGGRFAYRGGVVPARCGFDPGPLFAAVRSVPGLLGWVGVDFVWDDAGGRLAVLEINPRATTSYVGFREVLRDHSSVSSGIARTWLSLATSTSPDVLFPFEAANEMPPLRFHADGRIEREAETL